jgi:phospholipid N-methyltransferase
MLRRVALVRTTRRNNPEDTILHSRIFLRSVRRLLVTANVVPSSSILVTLMMQALRFFETSVLTRATWRSIIEDAILHSRAHEQREQLFSYSKREAFSPSDNERLTAGTAVQAQTKLKNDF